MIDTWMPKVKAVWAVGLNDTFGASVRSFCPMDTDFPESVNPSELDQSPIALTFTPALDPMYSKGGTRKARWYGVTEFHLSSNFAKATQPQLLPWYMRILKAAAANPLLDTTVDWFGIPDERDAISGLISLQYGNEAEHWGMVVHWVVEETYGNLLPVGGPP